jgi:hypothetical protein
MKDEKKEDMTDEKKEEQILPGYDVPEFYVNTVRIITSIYDIQMNLAIRRGPNDQPKEIALIRMSPQHALAMCKLFEKHLQAYENKFGKIPMSQQLLNTMGLGEDDSNADN